MASSNFNDVQSTEQFQALLSTDLNRVSLISFWAPWAEPCKQMNEVVSELAKKYPALLVLQVEAEEQSEIAESFDVDSVPTFIVLRGHTLLQRISGADAAALSQAIAKHLTPTVAQPLSRTTVPPAAASDNLTEKIETEEELDTRLRGLMTQKKVVLFMKGTPEAPRCGFSRKITGILKEQNIDYTHFDILTDESVRQGLKKLNDWPTFPQLIINGELVGGVDIVEEMAGNGELKEIAA